MTNSRSTGAGLWETLLWTLALGALKKQSVESGVFWTRCHLLLPSRPRCCRPSYTIGGIFHHSDQSSFSCHLTEHTRSRLWVTLSLFSLRLPLYLSPQSSLCLLQRNRRFLILIYKCETCSEQSIFLKRKQEFHIFYWGFSCHKIFRISGFLSDCSPLHKY